MKKIFNLFLISLLSLCLFGCHGSKQLNAFEMPEEFDTSKQYNVVFWNKNDTNITQVNIYKQAIDEFHKLYPNITVEMKSYNDYNKIYNDVITNISTNTTPNVCVSYPDHIATYMTGKNIVVELDELINNNKYGLGGNDVKFDSVLKESIVPQFLDECIIDDKYVALPFMRSTEAVYINKTYVEKLGYKLPEVLTWDFLLEVSNAALNKNDDGTYKINNQNVMVPFIYKSTDNMMIQMIKQMGSGYCDSNGNVQIFNDTTKELLKMIAPSCASKAFSTFKISSYPGNYLNAGQCIFGVDSTAGATWMGSSAPMQDIHESNIVQFETEVMMIPQLTDNQYMISQGPSLCLFNKNDPQEVLASWLFMQYLLTYDVQFDYSNTEGYVPVTFDVINSDKFNEYLSLSGSDIEHYDVKIKAKQILLNNLDKTFVTPVYNGSTSLRNAAGQLIEEVAKSSLRQETIDDKYFDELFSKMNSMYRLDQNSSLLDTDVNLGVLPNSSKVLLSILVIVWIFIAIYYVYTMIKRKKQL